MTKKKRRLIKRITRLSIVILPLIILGILLFAPIFIHVNGNRTVTVEVFSEYQDQGASSRIGGKIKTSGKVNTDKVGTYTIKYKWFLESATRKVKVVDTTAPELSLDGDEEVDVVVNSKYVEKGYEVSDNYDEDVKVEIKNNLDTSKLGKQEVKYIAKDSSNNKTTIVRTVNIVEDDYKYENVINNEAGVPDDVLNSLLDFYNMIYKSMRYNEIEDFSSYYEDANDAHILETSLTYLFDYRAMSNCDLTLNDCYYDLTLEKMIKQGNRVVITFLEDCHVNFNFMYEEESNIYGIEDSITFVYENNQYKIADFSKGEGYYLMFYESDNLSSAYDTYMAVAKSQNEKNEQDRQAVLDGTAALTKTAAYSYDREAAVAYANTYYHERNSEYFSVPLNNCMNYGSQVLYAGGIPMDYSGSAANYEQWKNYGDLYDESEAAVGYNYTWTYIPYFRSYVQNNTGAGLVAELNANLYLGEGGDLIQISRTGLDDPIHNMVVVGTVENSDGEIVDLLVNGNTLDMYNYPLSASAYPYKSLVKIIGYN